MNLKEAMIQFLPKIESEMIRLLTPYHYNYDAFFGMLQYHMGWVDKEFKPAQIKSGKRLRPLLTLLCCKACGGNPEEALTPAAAVEFIHNFSLIHDDIEDDSASRRGRKTVWSIWGIPLAINAGDALLGMGRRVILDMNPKITPIPAIFDMANRLDHTCITLCRGQYLDMAFEKDMGIDLPAYLEMIEGKTASLLACAGFLGGVVATHNPLKSELFSELGWSLGLAFQIKDDWLGIWGDETKTGKQRAEDLYQRKKSMPVVFTLNHPNKSLSNRFREIYKQDTLQEQDVNELITILEEIGAKEHTTKYAQRCVDQAWGALERIDAPAQDKLALEEIAHFFVERKY